MNKKLKILYLAAEAEPFIKIGGLGDVAGSLPPALSALGDIDIRLVVPFHGAIQRQSYPLQQVATYEVSHSAGPIVANVLRTDFDELPVYLISGTPIPPDAPVYSPETGVDGFKFTFFSLAALELIRHLQWTPDILHANDWHTAPAIYALHLRDDSHYKSIATLLGIHNLPYLGVGAEDALSSFGLPPATDSPLPRWAQGAPLPLGLLTADHIVAVSPTYADEILTPEFSSGLEDFLQLRADDISGILNGINTHHWDPANDQMIESCYSRDTLERRKANKTALTGEFGLNPNPEIPLLAMINRIDPQKGVDLVPEAMRSIIDLPWQMIMLGTGMPDLEAEIRQLETDFPERIRAALRFDSVLSHRIYAGADALLIPSRYEPCGLTQMIAMRYGCVPIARATGGLRDTVVDYRMGRWSTGFLFDQATPEDLCVAIHRATKTFSRRQSWGKLQGRGMKGDFSWERSALQYLKLYKSLVAKKKKEIKL
ncbi:MAG: glycogen/starch synthase [Anaerolineales bacterium]|jgi:starch synthase